MVGLREFRSMGCTVVVGGASAPEQRTIERLFADRERLFSRFVAASELNLVNAAAGRPVRVSQAFADMLALALDAAAETDGLVVPTLGSQLEDAGYDRDFSALEDDLRPPADAEPPRGAVRVSGRWVGVPDGVRLDLNGVVKGRTVDDALSIMRGDGFVSAGGDLAARGPVVAALPGGGTVRLVRGALATSGTDRRRWSRGGRLQHHLIDPRTGRPSDVAVGAGDRLRPHLYRRRHRREGGVPARHGRPGVARRTRPARPLRHLGRRHTPERHLAGEPRAGSRRRLTTCT